MAEQSGMMHEVGALRMDVESVSVLRAAQSQQSEALQTVQSTVFKCAFQPPPIYPAHIVPPSSICGLQLPASALEALESFSLELDLFTTFCT